MPLIGDMTVGTGTGVGLAGRGLGLLLIRRLPRNVLGFYLPPLFDVGLTIGSLGPPPLFGGAFV